MEKGSQTKNEEKKISDKSHTLKTNRISGHERETHLRDRFILCFSANAAALSASWAEQATISAEDKYFKACVKS